MRSRIYSLFGVLLAMLSLTVSETHAILLCDGPNVSGQWDLADNASIDLPIQYDVGDTSTSAYTVTQAQFRATHTFAGDLGGKLITPDGTIAHLWQLGDGTVAPSTPTASSCGRDGYDMIFQDAGGGPVLRQANEATYCIGTNVDTLTSGAGGIGSPYVWSRSNPASAGIRGTATPINLLSTLAGHPVYGTWIFRVKDSYDQDVGSITQVCIDISYAGQAFNYYVSTNPTCADSLTGVTLNQGQTGYVCASVINKGTETWEVRAGDASTTLGTDLSSFEHGYAIRNAVGSSGSVITSFIAGTGGFPVGVNTYTGSVRVYGTDVKFTSTGTLSVTKAIRVTVLDITPPVAPTATSIGGDSTAPFATTDTTPTVTGTGEANTLITIRNASGAIIGTGMTDGSGVYSITLPTRPEGDQAISITNTDSSGNVSPATNVSFTVDTTAPSAPTLTSVGGDVTSAYITNNPTPTFTGTAEPNSLITILDGSGTIIGTGMTNGSGTFAITPSVAIPDGGVYPFTATATDALGNVSSVLAIPLTIDTTTPVAPTISSPANNTLTSDTTPTLTGTGEPNTAFTITNASGTVLGTGTVDGSGNWTFTPSSLLPEGSSTLSIVTTDTAGNISPSASVTLLIDSLSPSTPTVNNVAGDTTPTYLTSDTTPTIVGTAEPGSTIEIKNASGITLGTVTADGSGNWTFTPSSPLPEGTNNLTATATDLAGNTSSPLSLPIVIDTVVPSAPTIANPNPGLVTNDTTPTINGTGEPGSIFTITDSSGTVIGTGVVSGSGTYSFTPSIPLLEGSNTLSVTTTDAAGNTSSPTSVTFTIDTTAPPPLTITDPINGSITSDTTPTINGTGEPGSIFTIRNAGGTILGTGTVDGLGNYAFTPSAPLPEGSNTYSVTLTDLAGNTTSVLSTVFTIDTTAPITPTISTPANNTLTSDTTPTLTGTGEPNTVFTITNASGTVLGTGTVDGSGNWTFTPVSPLPEGSSTLSIVTTDAAGNTSPSASVTLLIDSLPPSTPVVSNVAGDTTPTYLTSDTTPTITGTAEPGSTIEIKNASSTTLGTVTADGSGNWTFTPTTPLPEGTNNLTATSTDTAGNTSSPISLPIVIDTVAPVAPSVTTVAGQVSTGGTTLTSDTTPTITGTGEIGSIVTLRDGSGTIIATGIVDANGNYSITPIAPLREGIQTLTLILTDATGNISPVININLNIDPIPPDTILVSTSPTALSGSTITLPSVTYTFTTTETGSIFQCAIDGGAYTGCTSPVTYGGLLDGIHTITARAIDQAGNIDTTPLTITFTKFSLGSGGSAGSSSSAATSSSSSASVTSTSLADRPLTSTPAPVVSPTPPSPTISNSENLVGSHVLIFTPTDDTSLPSQSSSLTPSGKTKDNQTVFELKDRVTDYVCPKIVKMYNTEDIAATDIPAGSFEDDIDAVLMFRGLEKDEDTTGIRTIKTYQNAGVALNNPTFEPTRAVTRAEYVKMLVRSLSCRYTFMGTDSGFPDVDQTKWYAEYITFGVKNGWMNGYADGNFHPDTPITRAEAAKILANAIKLASPTVNSSFTDVPNTNTFTAYIEALKDKKIISGTSLTTFDPNRNIPRTEVSRIIYKTFLGGKR